MSQSNFGSLCRDQFSVATHGQLRKAGVSESTRRAQVAAGRWRQVNERVTVLHNGPWTRQQQLWIVCLSSEGPVALCSLTALQEAGLVGFETADIHAVFPRGAKLLPTPGIPLVAHESRRFTDKDIVVRHSLPMTSVERSAIDAAAWSKDNRFAARVLSDAVRQRLTVAPRIELALAESGKIRFHRLMASLLADIGGGAHALSELDFLRFCRRHGFPRPQLQVRRDSQGRRRYLDAKLKRRDGKWIHIEVDGGIHLTLAIRWNDTAKDNDDVIEGRGVLRFVSVAIYTDDPRAVSQIRRALEMPLSSDGGVAIAT